MKRFFCCKRILALCLAFAMCLMSGCGKESGSGKKKIVLNEVAHSIFYAPLYVALEQGYFEEYGIEVELVTGFGADKTMTALLTDAAEIGLMGSESTVYTYAGGAKEYVVNFALLTKRAGNFLVAREKADSFSWDKLKGKTVLGGRAGGMPEMIFEFILEKNNVDKSELTIDQTIDFGSTAAAFAGGQGDYTLEFEPYATALESKRDGYVVASLGEASGYVPYTAFCAKKDYLESHGEEVQSFTNAVQKGLDFVNAHSSEEIAEVIKPQFKETDTDSLTTIIERYYKQNTWEQNLVYRPEGFELLIQILLDAGVIDETVPFEELVDTTYAQSAAEK